MKILNNRQQSLRPQVKKEDPYEKVARGMEEQFANFMIEKMQKTVSPANPKSSAEKFYQGTLNREMAKEMAMSNNGLGLKEIILEQISPRYRKASLNNPYSNIQKAVTNKEAL